MDLEFLWRTVENLHSCIRCRCIAFSVHRFTSAGDFPNEPSLCIAIFSQTQLLQQRELSITWGHSTIVFAFYADER